MVRKASEIKGKVDFGIITIREDEFRAVLQRFSPSDSAEGQRRYALSSLQTNSSEQYLISIARCPEQGTGEGQDIARDLIEDLDPQWLILVGIAGGVPSDDFTLGDVVAAIRLHDFCVGAAIEGRSPEYAVAGGPMHKAVQDLLAFLPALENGLEGWNDEDSIGLTHPPVEIEADNFYGDAQWQEKVRQSLTRHFRISDSPRIPLFTTGSIASSDRLVKDSEVIRNWREAARQVLAVEMELAGVYRAARRRDREYPILAIRGISDIVGFRRHPDWTIYACHSAAAFAYALLKTRPIAPRSLDFRPLITEPEKRGMESPSSISEQAPEHQSQQVNPELATMKAIGAYSLPYSPENFVNREATLELLQKWLDDEQKRIYIIGGPSGRGKTHLAAELVRQIREKSRQSKNGDGWRIHWVECDQVRKGIQVDLNYLLISCYKAFIKASEEHEAKIKAAEEHAEMNEIDYIDIGELLDDTTERVGNKSIGIVDRLGSLIECLTRDRWLIILNDYHTVEDTDLREFVERAGGAPKSKVLAVVRQNVVRTLSEARVKCAYDELYLEPLTPEFVPEYLNHLGLSSITEGEAMTIWEKCGRGEPIAMDIFAGAIKRRYWSKEELLRKPLPDWSDDSQAWIQRMVQDLESDEHKAARIISIFTEPAERELIEHTCNFPEARQAVNGLIDRFLLARNTQGRFSFHPVLREYWHHQLDRSQEQTLLKDLHTRAAQWLEAEYEREK